MARAFQSLRVIRLNSDTKKPVLNILVSKKTGYMNVTINGTLFYYNLTQAFKDPNDIDFDEIANYQNTTGKKVIVVKRK